VRVRTVLVERDDALRRAREDLEGVRSLASTWEAAVVTARAQLQQGRAALQEAEGMKAALADKAAALTAAEEHLQQERAVRQEAEGQLQRERAALVEVRATLEQEWMVLTQKVHLAPNTQQAEQAGFTRAKSHKTCQSIFSEN
jgi:chromosome segregation ATPase